MRFILLSKMKREDGKVLEWEQIPEIVANQYMNKLFPTFQALPPELFDLPKDLDRLFKIYNVGKDIQLSSHALSPHSEQSSKSMT